MKIIEIVERVRAEKLIPGRFPARIVFVRNRDDYFELVGNLDDVCDVALNLSDYTTGDIVPKFKNLKADIAKNTGKTILILSFGEYLRLCAKRESSRESATFRSIWEPDPVQSEHETTKYIIPIYGGRDLFDNAVPFVDSRMTPFIWEVTESKADDYYKLTIYAPEFAGAIDVDADSFSSWLKNWDTLLKEKRDSYSLRTKLFLQTDTSLGGAKVKIVNDPYSYVVSLVTDGSALCKEYGNELFWIEMAKHVQAGAPFSYTIDLMLNVGNKFDHAQVLALFDQFDETKRLLVWIRYKLYGKNDYVSSAITKTDSPQEICLAIRDFIFSIAKPTDDQLADRVKALSVLKTHYDHTYFAKLDNVLPVESRLEYLTCATNEERAYAVKTISDLFRKGADAVAISDLIRKSYPALAEYIMPSLKKNDAVTLYFNWYRKSKLINRIPEDVPRLSFDMIDSRNKVMQNTESGYSIWIDGLGAEYMPLLLSELNYISIPHYVDAVVAHAIIPSETAYNRQWEADDEKWDRLDKLSHSGSPDDKDYYSCIVSQIQCICSVARRVGELLSENNCVIITGDHGSSRLAALMFHQADNFSIVPPKNAKVRSFGRFYELTDDSEPAITPSMEVVTSLRDGKPVKCVVMKTYEHFKQSGNIAGGNTDDNAIAGEVHGGMTPEEYLVPVVVVKRKILIEPPSTTAKRNAATENKMGI